MKSLASLQIEVIDEQWRENHLEAMSCWKFGDLLLFCVETFERINREDESWRLEVLQGREKHDDAVDEACAKTYAKWFHICKRFESVLRQFQQQGHDVEHADRFVQCLSEAEGVMTDDATFFAGDHLAALRDSAIDEHRRGDTLDVDRPE